MAVANEMISQEMVDATGIVPSNAPTSKVLAASGGSAVGGALGTIMTWMICSHIEPPPLTDNVRGAIALLVTAACGAVVAGVSGYLARPQPQTRIIYDHKNRPRIARRVD